MRKSRIVAFVLLAICSAYLIFRYIQFRQMKGDVQMLENVLDNSLKNGCTPLMSQEKFDNAVKFVKSDTLNYFSQQNISKVKMYIHESDSVNFQFIYLGAQKDLISYLESTNEKNIVEREPRYTDLLFGNLVILGFIDREKPVDCYTCREDGKSGLVIYDSTHIVLDYNQTLEMARSLEELSLFKVFIPPNFDTTYRKFKMNVDLNTKSGHFQLSCDHYRNADSVYVRQNEDYFQAVDAKVREWLMKHNFKRIDFEIFVIKE